MKKVLSTIVVSLVAVAFAGIALAAEPTSTIDPASPAKPEVKKTACKKKHHKKHKAAKPAPKTEAPAQEAAPTN